MLIMLVIAYVIVDEDCSPSMTTLYSLGCIPYSLATLVLVIASNPAVITRVINKTFMLHIINQKALLSCAFGSLMNISATFQTSNLIHQSDSLPKLPNIFVVIFSGYIR